MNKSILAIALISALALGSCARGHKPKRPAKMKRSNWRRGRHAVDIPNQQPKTFNFATFNL